MLCVLCQWVNSSTDTCFPAVSTIASHASLGETAVRGAIKRLVDAGAVLVEERFTEQGDRDSNLYTVIGYDPDPRGVVREVRHPPRQTHHGGSPREGGVVRQVRGNVLSSNDLTLTSSSSSSREILLASVPNRQAWEAEMNAALQGMHGPPLTPAQLDQAINDYVGNGASDAPNLRQFRAYLRSSGKPSSGTAIAPRRKTIGERSFENAMRAVESIAGEDR